MKNAHELVVESIDFLEKLCEQDDDPKRRDVSRKYIAEIREMLAEDHDKEQAA